MGITCLYDSEYDSGYRYQHVKHVKTHIAKLSQMEARMVAVTCGLLMRESLMVLRGLSVSAETLGACCACPEAACRVRTQARTHARIQANMPDRNADMQTYWRGGGQVTRILIHK